jgi:hypothetical protein
MDELFIHFQNPNFPILCSMFDACDPGHTRGCSDYFEDQLLQMLENTSDIEKKALIEKELSILKTVSWVEVHD